jgi:hypothetical protein
MDVTEETSLLGLAEAGPRPELPDAADIVEQRSGEQEIGAKSRMELRGLAAERRNADGVLEEPAGVAVVPVRSRSGKRSQCGARRAVS